MQMKKQAQMYRITSLFPDEKKHLCKVMTLVMPETFQYSRSVFGGAVAAI